MKTHSLSPLSSASLAAALFGLLAALPACKGQDPALLLTITTAQGTSFRVPQDADAIRLDIYQNESELVTTQQLDLDAGTNFPYTVTLVETGQDYPQLKVNATVTLQGAEVGYGSVDNVAMSGGSTVDATVTVTAQ